jgi:hypothetical protein
MIELTLIRNHADVVNCGVFAGTVITMPNHARLRCSFSYYRPVLVHCFSVW